MTADAEAGRGTGPCPGDPGQDRVQFEAGLSDLERRVGHSFQRRQLLHCALTHRSASGAAANNEQLEFLGDALLGFLVAARLMEVAPGCNEGELSRLRATVVSTTALARQGKALGLGPLLRLGRGEAASRGRGKPSILAGAFEALVGAVYLDGGIEAAAAMIQRTCSSAIEALVLGGGGRSKDAKTELQEQLQGAGLEPPVYVVVQATGPAHRRLFLVEARLGERVLARGEGRSKQQAEQAAAGRALAAGKPQGWLDPST